MELAELGTTLRAKVKKKKASNKERNYKCDV